MEVRFSSRENLSFERSRLTCQTGHIHQASASRTALGRPFKQLQRSSVWFSLDFAFAVDNAAYRLSRYAELFGNLPLRESVLGKLFDPINRVLL
jgi:hypothetical protein